MHEERQQKDRKIAEYKAAKAALEEEQSTLEQHMRTLEKTVQARGQSELCHDVSFPPASHTHVPALRRGGGVPVGSQRRHFPDGQPRSLSVAHGVRGPARVRHRGG